MTQASEVLTDLEVTLSFKRYRPIVRNRDDIETLYMSCPLNPNGNYIYHLLLQPKTLYFSRRMFSFQLNKIFSNWSLSWRRVAFSLQYELNFQILFIRASSLKGEKVYKIHMSDQIPPTIQFHLLHERPSQMTYSSRRRKGQVSLSATQTTIAIISQLVTRCVTCKLDESSQVLNGSVILDSDPYFWQIL